MKPSFTASVDSVLIGKALSKLEPGEEISYDDLEKIVPGRDLRGKHRYIMDTGRGLALKEASVVTGCVNGSGLKRLTAEEIVQIPDSTLSHIRKVTRKASRKVLCSDYEKLSADDKQKFNAGLSVLGAITQFTSQKALNAVNEKVEKVLGRLPTEETLMLFLKSGK